MTMTLRAVFLAASALALSPAYAADEPKADDKPAAEKPAEGKDYTILKVDGQDIKNSEVLDVWKGLFQGGSVPDFNSFDENIRQNVLRGLVSERLIYNEAVKAGYDKNDEVKKRLAAIEKQVIMQTYMEKKAANLVSDKELKAAYDAKAASAKNEEEVKARHILVESEKEAKTIADELKKGADFDKLAKEKSTDKGSGAKGGDLGWFTKDKMVPEFAEAAYKLKKGEVSGPVKSPFGWHIIKLDDRRPLKLASFDEMKESLRAELTNKAVQQYVEGLLQKTDIKYYDVSGKEKPFSRNLAPAAGGNADAEKQDKE